MTKLPLPTAQRLEKIILRLGFARIRQRGSHIFYRHPDGRTTTIPFHKSRVISRPLLREILREIELTVEEFNQRMND